MSYQDEDIIEDVEPLKDFELDESGGELTEPDAPVSWHTKKKGV